jgi:hypothetical protein
MRTPGISFIVRCHNEEGTLRRCIESLDGLRIPYEIVLVLHNCTDRSGEIAWDLAGNIARNIQGCQYSLPVSRAGYETLITPKDDLHSIMTYYNYCWSMASYRWTMKWDADMWATPGLIEELNQLDLAIYRATVCKIPCRLGSGVCNTEAYLTNCTKGFGKGVFWEVPIYSAEPQYWMLQHEIQSVDNSVLKPYWRGSPWFELCGRMDLLRKYVDAVHILGGEPIGMARASNPACDAPLRLVHVKEQELRDRGINLYE